MTVERGHGGGPAAARFLAAGLARAQVLEAIPATAAQTPSNDTEHVAGTPSDAVMAATARPRAPRSPAPSRPSRTPRGGAPRRDGRIATSAAALLPAAAPALAQAPTAAGDPACFTATPGRAMERDEAGVLTVTFGEDGAPLTFTAEHHEAFVDAFHEVGRDRENTVAILAGHPEGTIAGIEFDYVSGPDV